MKFHTYTYYQYRSGKKVLRDEIHLTIDLIENLDGSSWDLKTIITYELGNLPPNLH